MSEFFRRLGFYLHRSRLEKELASEMEFHSEMAATQNNSAAHEKVPLGNRMRLREEAREEWGWLWLDQFLQDLRYAVRMLRKAPGFTLAALLTLALGIGVNVAVFGFVDLILLRPLPVRDPQTLLRFKRFSLERYNYALPYPEVAFFRQHTRTLSAVIALRGAKLQAEKEESPLNAAFVTANFFSELGGVPEAGQLLHPLRDERPGSAPVVVLSYNYWRNRYVGDRSVIGSTIRLNGHPATIVGVASATFCGLSLDNPDVWVPVVQQPYFVTGSRLLEDYSADGGGVRMFGRYNPSASPRAVEEELRTLAAELYRQHPRELWEKEILRSMPAANARSLLAGDRSGSGSESADPIYPGVGLAGVLSLFILFVACSNLGGLLLARGVARSREIAIRLSVGAGAARLMRQLFTESLLLASLGALTGLILGQIIIRFLAANTGGPMWLAATMTFLPDWRMLLFASGVGCLAALLFGLTPALQLARQQHRVQRTRRLLVCVQVAGSCILLIVAGLLVRALQSFVSMNPGFAFSQVVSVDPHLASHGYSPLESRNYLDRLKSRVAVIPGVESVALTDSPPLGNRRAVASVDVNSRPVDIQINRVDPAFFATMNIPLLRGRNLTRVDTNSVVVGQSFARKWPTGDPLGQDLSLDGSFTVVGVVGTARVVSLEDADSVEAYFPARPNDFPGLTLLVKGVAGPDALAQSVGRVARALEPGVFPEVLTLKSSYRRKMQAMEGGALAVAALGLLALVLACLGITGLVAYTVSQRTREIGLRMALGAKPSHVLKLLLSQFSIPVLLGLFLGIGAAAALSQVLRRVLYGVSNLDPLAYFIAIGVFLVTVTLASVVPARRALRVDPMLALRHD